MMRKIIRFTKSQSAQGMVEFALVLPVLMLIILGVFAFGHMFFAYSSVVSASREAARWGAAVGESIGPYPRYKDCDAIRDAAVRVGSFAGVNRSTVTITYDKGPSDPTNPKPVCPTADGSQGPDVTLGSRINVNVTVQYTPIVPLLQLPSFPLTATTSRTILLALPVGEVPKANPLYPTTTLNVTVNNVVVVLDNPGSSSVVNQVFPMSVTVSASDGTIPSGSVKFTDDTGQSCGYVTMDATGTAQCNTFFYTSVTTDASGINTPHVIQIQYLPGAAHYNPSQVTVNHSVNQATTVTTINNIANTTTSTAATTGAPNQQLTVTVKVSPEFVAPSFSGIPSGKVELRLSDQTTVVASGFLNTSGSAALSFLPTWTGYQTLTAFYVGDLNFTGSKSAASPYTVEALDVNLYPQPTEGVVGTDIAFTVMVTPMNGSLGTPTGTVLIFETNNSSHSCQADLSSGTGSCVLSKFNTAGSYGMTVNYTSGDLNYKNKTTTFTLSIINKILTSVTLSPASSTVPPNTPVTFTVAVTQADGVNPSGNVVITSSLGSSYTCTISLKNKQTGSCQMPGLPFGGPYSFVAAFTPTDTVKISSGISNTATVTVSSMCPTASNVTILDNSLQFNVNNKSPNNVALNVNEVKVNWANIPPNQLKDIVFVESPQSNTCTTNGTDNICLWSYVKQSASDTNVGVYNPPQRFGLNTNNKNGWNTALANIGQNITKVFRLDFSIPLAQGNTVDITFDQGCTLSVTK